MSDIRLYDMLPYSVKSNDPKEAIKKFFDAVQRDYFRLTEETKAISVLLDVDGVNVPKRYSDGGILLTTSNFSGFSDDLQHGEQILIGTAQYPDKLVFAPGTFIATDDYYVGCGVINLKDPTSASPATNTYGKYRTIIDFDEATGTATVNEDWRAVTFSDEEFLGEIAYPLTGYLPVPGYQDSDSALAASGMTFSLHGDNNYNYDAVVPQAHIDMEDVYVGMYARVQRRQIDPNNTEDVLLDIQTRQIIEYSPVTGVFRVDRAWDEPPTVAHTIGIVPTFVSLDYLAQMVGYKLEPDDPEILQRQQIANAVNLYKLKGTHKAYKLLFKTFGFDVKITEITSNYTHAPETGWFNVADNDPPDVTASEPAHIEYRDGIDIGAPSSAESLANAAMFVPNLQEGTALSVYFDSVTTDANATATISGRTIELSSSDGGAGSGTLLERTYPQGEDTSIYIYDLSMIVGVGTAFSGGDTLDLITMRSNIDPSEAISLQLIASNVLKITGDGTNEFASTPVTTNHTFTVGQVVNIRVAMKTGTSSDGWFQVFLGTGKPELIYESKGIDTLADGRHFQLGETNASTLTYQIGYSNIRVGLADKDKLLQVGGGEDEIKRIIDTLAVDGASGNTTIQVPDSDIDVFLKPLVPGVNLGATDFDELRRRIEIIRPIHVEIGLIGSISNLDESLLVQAIPGIAAAHFVPENLDVSTELTVSGALLAQPVDNATVATTLKLTQPIRWDRTGVDTYTSPLFKGWSSVGVLFEG